MHPDTLLERFDAWEARTRGLRSRLGRTCLEPKYRPLFAGQRLERGIVDDARIPGLLAKLRERLALKTEAPKKRPARKRAASAVPKRVAYQGTGELAELELMLRPDQAVSNFAATGFLGSLSGLTHHVAFELVAVADRIIPQFVCDVRDYRLVRAGLRSYFPDMRVREGRHVLADRWLENEGHAAIFGLGLGERVFQMLNASVRLETDPLIAVIGSMDDLSTDELAAVQVLFAPARFPWGNEIEAFVSSIEDDDHVLPLVRRKFSEPLFAASLRVAALATQPHDAIDRAMRLSHALRNVTRSDANQLVFAREAKHSFEAQQADFLDRQTRRNGMLLSLSELATLVHPPAPSVRSTKLVRDAARTKAAPPTVLGQGLLIGENEHEGETHPVRLPAEIRARHTWILGATGTGKSTLLLNIAIQDIEAGNGFALIDPHGDVVEEILKRIPEHRARDVALIDPSDTDYPVCFNVLAPHSELERTLIASDFEAVFRRLSSTTFGDQMSSLLSNAVLAILESTQGGSLLDLRRFLADKDFRSTFLGTVQDEEVVDFWKGEASLVKGSSHGSILTRLNTFLRPKSIRHMVAQRDNKLDMRAMMDGRRILLCKLSHGLMGAENSYLLGSLIVSELARAALSRQDEKTAERVPFAIAIDDFHHFMTPSLATVLSSTRKYAVSLCLASHELRQTRVRSEEVASALFAHAATRIVFHVGDHDAKVLADGFSFFESRDIQELGVGEAVARVERKGSDFNLRTPLPEPVEEIVATTRREAVIALSRERYATPRAMVEATLVASHKRDDTTGTTESAADGEKHQPRTRTPGRGGTQHKYLQGLVRKLGEERGYAVSLEREILGGHGYVDAILEKGDARIACEIAISTRASHEIGNLTKCLSADFSYVVLVSSRPAILRAARLELHTDARLRFLSPDGLVAFLDELDTPPSGGATPQKTSSELKADSIAGKRPRLDTHDAAKYVGLARQTLAKLRTVGGGPKFEKLGSRVVYDPDELDAWLLIRKRTSTSDRGPEEPRRRGRPKQG